MTDLICVGHQQRPWYRRAAVVATAGVLAVAVAVTALLAVHRVSGPAMDVTTGVGPATSNGAAPGDAPPRSAGTSRTDLPTAPPVPPPPPVTAEQMTPPPVITHSWPRSQAPSTVAPRPPASSPPSMSFAPQPVTPPKTATPGNNGHHGFF